MSLAATAHIHTQNNYHEIGNDGSKKNPKEPEVNPVNNRVSTQGDMIIAGSFNPGHIPTHATIPQQPMDGPLSFAPLSE